MCVGFVCVLVCKSTTLPGSLLVEVYWRNAEPAVHSSFLLSPVTVGVFFKLLGHTGVNCGETCNKRM